ncbi:MAG: phosphoribosylaminoimidazolesuccinocarboxamide synthase [Bacteroidota bacterium]|nr:phosphoribosylaminoimidazolesuccinocarboxamide synthase [Bacteroidota bacterium]
MTTTFTPALEGSTFQLNGQTSFYRGKVRDVYGISSGYLVMVASDRISAFDHILPRPIPGKGAILNQVAAHFLEITKDIMPNWLLSVPESRVSIGYQCETYPVEIVVRAYLCGHALREYTAGKRTLCGEDMPEGMKPYEAFPNPIITPTTKAHEGHDEDISRGEIIKRGLVSGDEYAQLEEYALALFNRGQEYAKKHGLILADTKYEFGRRNGEICLIDEIHTPDSSRYFYKEKFIENIKDGTTPKQLSKEFVREWLMENGFQGREGDIMPVMTDEVVNAIRARYIELYSILMGEEYDLSAIETDHAKLEAIINKALANLK